MDLPVARLQRVSVTVPRAGLCKGLWGFVVRLIVIMVAPARRLGRRSPGERDFSADGLQICRSPRDIAFAFALILAKGCAGALAGTRLFRRGVSVGRAGSRRGAPGWCGWLRWSSWLTPSFESLDDGHAPAAAWTRRERSAGPVSSISSGGGAWPSHSRARAMLASGRKWRAGRNVGCGGILAAGHLAGSGG
jgi:hypothetical protein